MSQLDEARFVEIGITTRNRWADLRDTLTKLAAFGWDRLRIRIIDDGSETACPFDVTAICPRAELRRFEQSQGLIVRRNQLAGTMEAKYFLSLDDDSYPVAGSLQAAVEFAESREDLLCLSFPIYNPLSGRHQVKSLRGSPYRVRAFIGCGHLLRRERFLELGGYCEALVHFLEEGEIAARGFQQGAHCYHFPDLQIHHTESSAGRDRQRMDYYAARNTVLWNDWYMPGRLSVIKQSRTFLARMMQTAATRRLGHLKGHLTGLKEIAEFRHRRQRMALRLYRQWQALPPC